MDCAVSEITIEDTPEIVLLNRELGYDVPPDLVRQRIQTITESTADKIFIARISGKAAGYIQISPYELLFDKPLMNVLGLVVLEKYRRNGCASKLIEHAEQYAKEQGYTGIRLNSGIDRTGAHAFYESQGYVHRKMHKHFIKRFD
jgi:GNAT superfamily N-acetyltransferase